MPTKKSPTRAGGSGHFETVVIWIFFLNVNAFPLETLYICVNIEIEPSISEKLCVMIILINRSHFDMAAILKILKVECITFSNVLFMGEVLLRSIHLIPSNRVKQ